MNIEEQLCLHGNETPHVSTILDGTTTVARLIDIIDGDTIVCVVPVLERFFKFNVRLNGIDTCEMKSHNLLERNKAIAARDYVVKSVFNEVLERKDLQSRLKQDPKLINLHCYDFDKYGRLLADVFIDGKSLSNELINANLGNPYSGGTKLLFDI